MSKREVIDVRVSQRILWVGGEAYPLRSIARVQTNKLVPRLGLALWGYLKTIVLWVFLGVVAAVVTGLLEFDSNALPRFVAVVGLVLIVSTIRLIAATRTFYELVIETAGAPYRALVSPDENLVTGLVHRIVDAINNPQAEWQVRVENHFGDKINQYGDHNVGKVQK